MPKPLYEPKSGSALSVDTAVYGPIARDTAGRKLDSSFVVPIRSGRAWTLRAGQVCRLVLVEGPQVVDLNLWHRDNPREKFWASRTKQLHGAHMHVGDRFWSVLPFLRPMATVTADTVNYGFDSDGAGCHDLLGTRCDPYIHKLLTGEELDVCCHSNLLRAVAKYHLGEYDVHDVLNVFQVTGLTRERNQYFVKPCPGKKGDYFEFFAEIDLLCAISTCPHGDMSVPIWGPNATDPLKVCRPLGVEVYDLDPALLHGWKSPPASDYAGMHGLRSV
ncbi:MAG: DUF1989 domain-containing protein [Betaproteobacteria bacterium]|nr:DUF1989 domain-containing protein [Betaproteobacteria bacterium]